MRGRRKKRHAAPDNHGKIADARPESLQIRGMKKQHSHQCSQSGGRGLGEEIVSRETDAENPVGKRDGRRLVIGARKNRPAAEKIR